MTTLPEFARGQSVGDWSADELRNLVDVVRELREWMEITKRLHLPELAKYEQLIEAEELQSTAPVLCVVGEPSPVRDAPFENASYHVRVWPVDRTPDPRRDGTGSYYKYYIGVRFGNVFVWPGKTLGWYRSNLHMHPFDTPVGTEVEPRHLWLYRIVRFWDREAEKYKHASYVQ